MSDKITKAKKLMEKGWKTRENLDFDKAEVLLNEAKSLFEQEEDWFNVTECLNHLALNEKLQAVHHLAKGMDFAQESENIAKTHNVRKDLVLRALMSLANTLGLYEQAIKWGEEALSYFKKDDEKADLLGHIAIFELRTGKIEKAKNTALEAEKLINNAYDNSKQPHHAIWKSKILLAKTLIYYNLDQINEAENFVKEAEELAIEQKLQTRLKETQAIKSLFEF